MSTVRVWDKLPETPDKPDGRKERPFIERRWINAPYDGPERRRKNRGPQPTSPPSDSGWRPLVPDSTASSAPPQTQSQEEVFNLWLPLPTRQD